MRTVVVIGAGIAGLSAAWELTLRGLTPIVLEKGPQPGGVILTERVDGYVIDAGPDSLLVDKPAGIALGRELGLADRLVSTRLPRTAFVVRGNRLVALPTASFLGLPTSVRSLAASRLFTPRGKARIAMEPFVHADRTLDDESIGAFVRRRFGDEACDWIAEPLLAGIHAGDVDRLSVHALFPQLVHAERTRGSVLRGVRAKRRSGAHGPFVSFPGGLQELPDALAARLGESTVRCHSAAVAIDGRGPFTIRLVTGDTLTTRALIVTTPAWAAAPLLGAIDTDLADRCAAIPYTSSAALVFALDREQVRHPLAGTGFVVPARERRVLMAATWVSSKWPHRAPPGRVLLRGYVGGVNDPGILDRSDDELLAAGFDELAERLEISGPPRLTRLYRWPRANPQYEVGHLAAVRAIDERLARVPGLYLTGSGYRGTGIPDCIADARAAAARAAEFLSRARERGDR